MTISFMQGDYENRPEWAATVREELQQIARSEGGLEVTNAIVTTAQGVSAGLGEVLTIGIQVVGSVACNMLASYLYDLVKDGSVKAFLHNTEILPDREFIQLKITACSEQERRHKDAAAGE